MKKDIIISIGEILWDIFPNGKKLGGAPANFAYIISQFNLNSCIVSAIGNDKLGEEILQNLKEKKLNYLADIIDYPTGTVLVELDKEGVPQYTIKQNVAWDNIPYNKELTDLLKNCKAICFGTLAQRDEISRNTILRSLEQVALNVNSLRIFDINLRQSFYNKEIILTSLKLCNILKLNNQELNILTELLEIKETNFKQVCDKIIKQYNLKILILTCGTDGSYVFIQNNYSYLPTPQVDVEDTVGAGDAFTAAFVASIIKGETIIQAHQIAVKTSAYICTQAGAMINIPKEIIS